MPGEEEKIIKQYQALIRALIPYEQDNRLLEGLNRFSKRIPSSVRKVVRDEVVRLSSLTDAPADNSAFAQFPVIKFKHFGVDMRLDKVGAHILKTESTLYQNRYTVGVFESITNSDFYQAHIKKEQYKKIVDAFTVETQSLRDIEFGDDIAIAPNFQVACIEFEKGRHFTVGALSNDSMVLESKRPPKVEKGKDYQFQLPEVFGSSGKEASVNYTLGKVCFNKETEKYETHFALSSDNDQKVPGQLTRYIKSAAFQQPLKRDLEVERALQDLERDRVLLNSPWVAIALKAGTQSLEPALALFTNANSKQNKGYGSLQAFEGKANFSALIDELTIFSEAFFFRGTIKTKQGDLNIEATHRQLLEYNLFTPVMYLLSRDKNMQCFHCRLTELDDDNKKVAFAIHDISRSEYPDLDGLSHMLFYTDISERLGPLVLLDPCQLGPVHRNLLADTKRNKIDFVVEDGLDRRQEPRYDIDKPASLKLGLLSSANARLTDISAHGMRLYLTEPPGKEKLALQVKVSVPEFRIKNERYDVIYYCEKSGLLRLKLPDGAKVEQAITQFLESNASYFRSKDSARRQRMMQRFIWELAMRHHPSASVICVANRFLLDRIKTLYIDEASQDLYPFTQEQNIAPLHGFFADQGQSKPKSSLLLSLLKAKSAQRGVIHCQRKSDRKLIFINEKDFLYKPLRQNIAGHLREEKTELCVTRVQSVKCDNTVSSMTKKRLAQLSKVDKIMYEKMLNMQASYTHVIYLTNESALQAALACAKLKPVVPKKAAPEVPVQKVAH